MHTNKRLRQQTFINNYTVLFFFCMLTSNIVSLIQMHCGFLIDFMMELLVFGLFVFCFQFTVVILYLLSLSFLLLLLFNVFRLSSRRYFQLYFAQNFTKKNNCKT